MRITDWLIYSFLKMRDGTRIILRTNNNPTEADRNRLLKKAEKFGSVSSFYMKYGMYAYIIFSNYCDAEQFVKSFLKNKKNWSINRINQNTNDTQIILQTGNATSQADFNSLLKKAWNFGSVSRFDMYNNEKDKVAYIEFINFCDAEQFAQNILNWKKSEPQLEYKKNWSINITEQETNWIRLELKTDKSIKQADLESLLKNAWNLGSVSQFDFLKESNTAKVYIEFINSNDAEQFAHALRVKKY